MSTLRVVVAPDSFKGSVTAAEAAEALAEGWRRERPHDDLLLLPVADGGEGTLEAFAQSIPHARRMPVRVTGPDGGAVDAQWLLLPATPDAPEGTGVVELASTSGIELLGDQRIAWDAGTEGFGQAIVAALDSGASRLILGVGSSASTDAGAGILRALGARVRDVHGADVRTGARGLLDVASVDLSALRGLPPGGVLVLSDVTSPLLGEGGAAAVFGPQKGFDGGEIALADAALARFAECVTGAAADVAVLAREPGAGAAGGSGFGMMVWGAEIAAGAERVAELVGVPGALAHADAVITGEGSYDGQSDTGKAPAHIAALAAGAGVPVSLVAGRVGAGVDATRFDSVVSLTELAGAAGDPADALVRPGHWLRLAGAALARRVFA